MRIISVIVKPLVPTETSVFVATRALQKLCTALDGSPEL